MLSRKSMKMKSEMNNGMIGAIVGVLPGRVRFKWCG
jgi:hypothetical protein